MHILGIGCLQTKEASEHNSLKVHSAQLSSVVVVLFICLSSQVKQTLLSHFIEKLRCGLLKQIQVHTETRAIGRNLFKTVSIIMEEYTHTHTHTHTLTHTQVPFFRESHPLKHSCIQAALILI